MSHIPNLRQWVAGWRIVKTQTLAAASTSFVFPNLDFTTNPIYRLVGIASSNGPLVQATIRVNGDSGNNYNNQRVTFYDNSGALGFQGGGTASQSAAVMGPGHTGNTGITDGEQVLLVIDIAKSAAGLFFRSTAFTNGSGAGDIHYMSSKWTGSSPISISVQSNVDVSGIFLPSQMGSFPIGCRFDLLTMNNDVLWAT